MAEVNALGGIGTPVHAIIPKSELYGLVGQMRRAAVFIPSNIAEGQGKSSTGEFRVAIGHAKGSLFELETQVLLANEFRFLNDACRIELLAIIEEQGRLLNGLLNSLEAKHANAAATTH